MPGLHQIQEGLRLTYEPKNGQNSSYSGVDRHDHKFLICCSPEGHKLFPNIRSNSGVHAIEFDKFHGRF